MKKIIALIFCLLFLFSACSGETENKTKLNKDNYASYVGAGEMTLINILVNSNAGFVKDIFIANHLPVDETKTVRNAKGEFAPVVSDEYKTLADLKARLEMTYTKEAVDAILADEKYVDIEGKLHFNTEYAESDYYKLDWSQPEVTASIDSEGKYIISITVKDEKGRKTIIEASAVSENGNLKLEKLYY